MNPERGRNDDFNFNMIFAKLSVKTEEVGETFLNVSWFPASLSRFRRLIFSVVQKKKVLGTEAKPYPVKFKSFYQN